MKHISILGWGIALAILIMPAMGGEDVEQAVGKFRLSNPQFTGQQLLPRPLPVPTPKVIGPLPSAISPARDYTWLTTTEDLKKYGYVEEEFYIDGAASAYKIPTDLTDCQLLGSGYAYRTRVVVRRPVNQKRFSGNVLLEWINVTTGVDIDFNWMESSDYIMRSGHAYVGVSAQKLGIDALGAWSPARYGSLEVTGAGQYLNDELSFDIYSQVARAIRDNQDTKLLGNLDHIRTIVATGPSQSGRFLSYYHNVIHPIYRVVDGFAIVAHTNPLRNDLDVKTMRLLTETDVRMEKELYQIFDYEPDTKYFRRWEVAGTSHIGWSDVLKYEPLLIRDRGFGLPVTTVTTPYSRIPIGHVASAAYERLFDWINKDKAPPMAPRIKWVGNSHIARDGYGNALGGIRLPEHQAPTATNTGEANGTEFFATLVGTYAPFSDELLQDLYPIHGRYVVSVVKSATSLLKQGFLLKEEALENIRESARVPLDGMNRPSGTVLINHGAAATNNPSLALTLSATGPRPVTRMRFSEGKAAWSPWEAFSPSGHFTLSTTAGRDGQKTVYAEFMDAAGRASGAAKDTILLDRTAPVGHVEIDHGAASTITPTVTVELVAKGAVEMQLMLDGDAGWRDWESFVQEQTLTLAGGSGTKTVQARFADAVGNISAVASATIRLQAGPIPLAEALVMMRPSAVWQHFYDLTQVPRPSHHEERASALVADFGRRLGLETLVDAAGNVIIRKPASAGRTKCPGVVLQAHLDMVPQRTPDAPSDPKTDPIHAFVQDGWVRADRTTLGADDGIGVALIMAILEADHIAHGPIEALFTVDEEDGFSGINALSPTALKGRLYINVDNEVEGEFLISSAGGIYVKATETYGEVATPPGMTGFTLTVDGLLGGHSGVDIDKGRGSAHQIMARLLVEAPSALGVRVASVAGGDLSNAIPRTTVTLVAIPTGQSAAFQIYVAEFATKVAGELATTDPKVTVTAQAAAVPLQVMDAAAQQALIGAVYDIPQGVYRMSAEVPGLVETSGNLGVLSIANGKFAAISYVRSAIDSERDAEAQRFAEVLVLAGATVIREGAYSSWSPNLDSPLLKLMTQVYLDMFGVSPEAAAIHAGLETSVAGVTYPGMDMISIGPTIIGVHSPDERLDVASVQKVFDLIVATLERVGHSDR